MSVFFLIIFVVVDDDDEGDAFVGACLPFLCAIQRRRRVVMMMDDDDDDYIYIVVVAIVVVDILYLIAILSPFDCYWQLSSLLLGGIVPTIMASAHPTQAS